MFSISKSLNEFQVAKLNNDMHIPYHFPHNPLWNEYAEIMIRNVTAMMPPGLIIDAEHIGSTSIPNTIARPAIAINFAVRSLGEFREHIEILYKYGWVLHTDKEDLLSFALFDMYDANIAGYQIFFITKEHRYWEAKKAFRDYLREHPDAAEEYSRIKLWAANKAGIKGGKDWEFPERAMDHYTNLKARFVFDILKKCGDRFNGLTYRPISKFSGGLIEGENTREPIENITMNQYNFMISVGDLRKQIVLLFGKQMPGNYTLFGKCLLPVGGYYGQSRATN